MLDYKDGDQPKGAPLGNSKPELIDGKINYAASNIGLKMMMKHGYKKGEGLGKYSQGRAEPVETSKQKGRRGLGLEFTELEKVCLDFKPEEEEVKEVEDIEWLNNNYENLISNEDLASWKSERKEGQRKQTLDGETLFCDEYIVKGIVDSKTMFDKLDKNEMREARTRSNPFETIRGAIFLNRAAVKMANIDKACDFKFTKAADQSTDGRKEDLLYFADVCAGPGGFSEYVLWRKKWRAKGFGFTLKCQNDFKLEDFIAGSSNTFHPYYGPAEDGDVFNPKNQIALQELIMSQTENQGVHFMMADGGFSVEGQENIQEILSKQLYLCQCLVALMIVRNGGHFVTKLFDLFTPFSAGLVYVMYRCFDKISIFKPNTSRPANSERYLICIGKKPNINHIVDYLFEINKKLCKNNESKDVLEIVPVEKLLSENEFFDYLKISNEILGQRQIIGLKKIAYYAENKQLIETRQAEMREKCLKYWDVPDTVRILPQKLGASQRATNILRVSSALEKVNHKNFTKLNKDNSQTIFSGRPLDYYCMPCSANDESEPTFYLADKSSVYKYTRDKSWRKIDFNIELPCDTLVYAEMTTEYKKEGMGQMKTSVMHIFDAFSLGTENISSKVFPARHKCIKIFCEALWKPDVCFQKDTPAPIRVRVKELIAVSDINTKLELVPKLMKGANKGSEKAFLINKYSYENSKDELFYIPKNILFFRVVEKPWHYEYSRGRQDFYFGNEKNNKSVWETPQEAVIDFIKTIQTQFVWTWPSDESFSKNDFVKLQEDFIRK